MLVGLLSLVQTKHSHHIRITLRICLHVQFVRVDKAYEWTIGMPLHLYIKYGSIVGTQLLLKMVLQTFFCQKSTCYVLEKQPSILFCCICLSLCLYGDRRWRKWSSSYAWSILLGLGNSECWVDIERMIFLDAGINLGPSSLFPFMVVDLWSSTKAVLVDAESQFWTETSFFQRLQLLKTQ